MFFIVLTVLVACTQAYTERCPIEMYSDDDLQRALDDKCHLAHIYREHRRTHLHSHTRPAMEEATRLKLFKQEILKVKRLRADPEVTWDVGLTFVADYTEEEKETVMSHRRNVTSSLKRTARAAGQNMPMPKGRKPASFDKWRENEHGIKMVSPIREQAKKSSFAHAAVIPLESQLGFLKKKFVRLSVEELYHCAEGDKYGQRIPRDCWKYVLKSGRLGSWYDHPESDVKKSFFRQEVHECEGFEETENYLAGYKIRQRLVTATSEFLVEQALYCVGPVVFEMDAKHNDLWNYKPNKNQLFKLRDTKCKRNDHALAFVGYDAEKFIVKNSWGEDWGIRGYFYLDRSGTECEIFDTTELPMLLRNDEDDLETCRWEK